MPPAAGLGGAKPMPPPAGLEGAANPPEPDDLGEAKPILPAAGLGGAKPEPPADLGGTGGAKPMPVAASLLMLLIDMVALPSKEKPPASPRAICSELFLGEIFS